MLTINLATLAGLAFLAATRPAFIPARIYNGALLGLAAFATGFAISAMPV